MDCFIIFNDNNTLMNWTTARSLHLFITIFLEQILRSKISGPQGTHILSVYAHSHKKRLSLHMLPHTHTHTPRIYHILPNIRYGHLFNLLQSDSRKMVLICTSWSISESNMNLSVPWSWMHLLLRNPCSYFFPSLSWSSCLLLVMRFLPLKIQIFTTEYISGSFFPHIMSFQCTKLLWHRCV